MVTCRSCNLDIICPEESKLSKPQEGILRELVGGTKFDLVSKDFVGASGRILIGTQISAFEQKESHCDICFLSL